MKHFILALVDSREQELLEPFREFNAKYAVQIGVSEASVKRCLGELKKGGFIIRVGSNKTGHWEPLLYASL